MKRCIMGLWLLIALLGIGILTCWGTKLLLEPISRDLEKVRAAGIGCQCGREETEGEIILTTRLQKTP